MTPLTHQTTPDELTKEPSGAPTPEMQRILDSISQASEPNSDSRGREAAYDSAHRDFADKYMALERLIRHDLGVEAFDEELA